MRAVTTNCKLILTSYLYIINSNNKLDTIIKSEAIDTDRSVALMVAKVTNDTDRWKSATETSIDTTLIT